MIFSIKKGRHYSDGLLYKIFSFLNFNTKKSYFVTFNETAIYSDDSKDRFDINKLFGFSVGTHHKNSYRFGWNCLDNQIHVYAYSYVNSKRVIKEICTVNINEENKFIIKIKGGKCIFSVINTNYKVYQAIIEIPRKKVFGYELWPYFGGNKTAPQNILIDLTKKD